MKKQRSRFLRWLIGLGGAVGLVCLFVGLYTSALQLTGNVHPVVDGVFYRSAQPSKEKIFAYARDYGLRSIINLRGEHVGAPWYDEEIAASKALGLSHYDFRMSAGHKLSLQETEALLALLRDAPKPVLVHCHSGADRTGLASALFLAAIAQKGEEAAEDQISFRYGHFSVPFFSSAFAMDTTFEGLEEWLGFDGS